MSNIKQAIQDILDIDGAFACAIVDYESGMALGSHTTQPAFNVEVAAAGNTEVVRAKMRVKKELGMGDQGVDDVLITLEKQYHVIRPLKTIPNLFIYAAFDKEKANLALARTKIKQVESQLQV